MSFHRIIYLIILFPLLLEAQSFPIKVDQFGYLPSAKKIAVCSDPEVGYNSANNYTPGALLEVKSVNSGTVVFSGVPVAWNAGAIHTASGDRAWQFDFSTVVATDDYYIYDPTNSISSDTFTIAPNIYKDIFETAFKTFYYQRCGQSKETPYCLNGYADPACHVQSLQDLNCRSIITKDAPSELDLSGGWHDAGDYNKYVNFLWAPLTDLLLSYETSAQAWTDDMDIPESGNYIPDVLDEVKVATDWLLKMQQPSGGVFCVVGVEQGAASPPSADAVQRFYGPMTTSASFTTAAVLSLAAKQFAKVNCAEAQNYVTVLNTAAKAAYNWAVANPNETFFNTSVVAAGEQEDSDPYRRSMRRLAANIYLYASSGNVVYKNYVESNYSNSHLSQWGFVYPFENEIQQALLYFAHLPGVNPTISSEIIADFKNSVDNTDDNYPAHINNWDPYGAYISDANTGWGSNGVKSTMGNIYHKYKYYDLDPSKHVILDDIIGSYVHYIHGVNPLGKVYLSNMESYGAERSMTQVYHGWFYDGSPIWDEVAVSTYGPAPGFLPGGPNPSWSLDACCDTDCGSAANNALCLNFSPPENQPILKSYLDWNSGWPQNFWSISETAIYYQSAYLSILADKISPVNLSVGPASRIDQGDLFLSALDGSLIMTSEDGHYYELIVDNDGILSTSPVMNLPNDMAGLIHSNLNIVSLSSGIILRSQNGTSWKLTVDSSNKIILNTVAPPVGTSVEVENGDIGLMSNGKGVILKNINADCFILRVNNAGKLILSDTTCP